MEELLVVNARFLTQSITGVQRFSIEISRQLKQLDKRIVFISPKNIIHHDLAEELEVESFGRFSGHAWEQFELPLYLKKKSSPLLINLANMAPLFYKNKVIIIHDVAFDRFPESFTFKFRYFYKFIVPKLLASSRLIATVSKFSRNEISDLYNINKNNILVIYNAVNNIFYPHFLDKCNKYILAVSSLNYQKNFHSLVKAFNSLGDSDLSLYLVGEFNRNFADTSLINEVSENERIILKGRVDDFELIKLYSNALCFVYPSLYEGFGIPPLEAQACSCPVIVSNAASLPEVFENSAVYCDPYNVEDIADKISLMVNNASLREDVIKKGFENIKRFSWEQSAQRLLDAVMKLNQ